MNINRICFLHFVMLFISFYANSQEKGTIEKLIHRMEMERYGSDSITISVLQMHIEDINPSIFFKTMEGYKNDSNIEVRELLYSSVARYGLANKDSMARRESVNFILGSYNDKAVAWQNSIFEKFDQRDYNDEARNKIRQLICCQNNVFDPYILYLVSGYLGLVDQIPVLEDLLHSGKISDKTNKRAIHLALARLGVEKEIDYFIAKVESYNEFDKAYEGFKRLSYIKHTKIIEYLKKQFYYSNGELSIDPNNSEIKAKTAHFALKYLIMMIDNFPFVVYRESVRLRNNKSKIPTDEIIKISKKWLDENFEKAIIDKKSFYAKGYENLPED